MSKTDFSRRKFISRTALTLPVAAAAIPAAMEITSPSTTAEAASVRQDIPNRIIPTRTIGSTTVTVSGLPTDETSDCSSIIQAAIDGLPAGGGTVIIPRTSTGGSGKNRCIYRLDCKANNDGAGAYWGLSMKSNVRLEFRPGVTLQSLTCDVARAYMVFCANVEDVEIVNGWFVGERQTHVYAGSGTDEHVYGINVAGCTGLNILGTYVSDQTGDGVQIGSYNSVSSSDIVICNSILTGNRRQALSITSGSDISLYDSEFSYTYGTLPMDGIDIEPQGSASVSNVTIDNCIIRGNQGNGIECNLQGTSLSGLDVKNCMIEDNYWNGLWTHVGSGGTVDTGTVYGNAFYQNGNYGLSLGNGTTNFTVGASASDGNFSNNFADNQNLYNTIQYPNTNKTNTNGYVSGGTDMNAGTTAQTANTWRWNSYFTH